MLAEKPAFGGLHCSSAWCCPFWCQLFQCYTSDASKAIQQRVSSYPERYIITLLVYEVHSSYISASEGISFNSDHFFFPHAQHACNPDEERCGTSALAAAFTIGQFIVKMSFWLLSFWAAWKRVCGAPLITAIAMSIALAGIIGAVQSSQRPCCPCKIVHPGLLKPVYDSNPIFMSPPGAAWRFSAELTLLPSHML